MPQWPAWRRPLPHFAIVIAFVLAALGSAPSQKSAARMRPLPSSQPVTPYFAAHDLARSVRVPDAAQSFDVTKQQGNALAPKLRATFKAQPQKKAP